MRLRGIVAGLVVVSCWLPAAPVAAGPSYEIAFVRATDGNELILATPDGSSEIEIEETHKAQTPAWSPDGTKLAFDSWRTNYNHIYIADLVNNSVKRITRGRRGFFEPAWSPDGQQIVFSAGGRPALGIVNSDGTGQQILIGSRKYWSVGKPSFSPDGKRILFHNCNSALRRPCFIKTMRPDGSRVRKLTSRSTASEPVWSPDGQQIAYEKWSRTDIDIYSMDADGSHKRRLTRTRKDEARPAWSPDSSLIAFDQNGRDIFVMNRNGAAKRKLTKGGWNWSPAWSGDGSQLVYLRTVHGYFDVFTIEVDGGERTRITRTDVPEFEPTWRPAAP